MTMSYRDAEHNMGLKAQSEAEMAKRKEPKYELTIEELVELHTLLYRHCYIPPEMEHAHSAFNKIVKFLDSVSEKEKEKT